MRQYNAITQVVREQSELPVQLNCNGYTVRNVGDTVAIINGITLQPPAGPGASGEAIVYEGNQDEVYIGRIQIQFANPLGTDPQVEVIQKFYLDGRH